MLKKVAFSLVLAGAPTAAPMLAGPAHADSPAQAPAQSTTAQFTVKGMMCAGCAGKVKKALAKLDGVQTVDVDLDKKLVVVSFDASKTTTDAVQKAIEDTGFTAEPTT
jgi:copper ion binding protein